MDKKLVLAVAGSGKTQYIIDRLNLNDKFLIITYTDNNYENIKIRILKKFNGSIPNNIYLITYFGFLFNFCYRPILADKVRAKGIYYETNKNMYLKQNDIKYYLTAQRYFYSNRLSLFLVNFCIDEIKRRLEKYFDLIIVDEVQDIGGRDFELLMEICNSNNNYLMVGDFFQHTYDTSLDGNVNKNLYSDEKEYIKRFNKKGIKVDNRLLNGSHRCAPKICNYIRENLKIDIYSNNNDLFDLYFIESADKIKDINLDDKIVKLHYRNASRYGKAHYNWGETKGVDSYYDVCVVLNKTTFQNYKNKTLHLLNPQTKNKLYVALTRAHGNVYLVEEAKLNKLITNDMI